MTPESDYLKQSAIDVFIHLKGNGVQKVDSLMELAKALHLMGRNPASNDLMNYWNAYGLSGQISFENFIKIASAEQELNIKRLLRVFIRLGGNAEGQINATRLKALLTSHGDFMSAQDVDRILRNYRITDGKFPYLSLCKDLLAYSSLKRNINGNSANEDHIDASNGTIKVDSRSPKKQNGARSIASASVDPFQNFKTMAVNGCFYLNDDRSVSNHQFVLTISEETAVSIAIEPASFKSDFDTELLFFSEKEGTGRNLLCCTQTRDEMGRFILSTQLAAGQYLLIPFTTGGHLKFRTSQPCLPIELTSSSQEGEELRATPKFKKALQQIFSSADLDRNGALNYEEFNIFCAWTCGEMASLEEWDVVKSNFITHSGELTEDGFLDLQLAQLEQNADGLEEVWAMLRKTGFNHVLDMDEACPFQITISWESGLANFRPMQVSPLSNVVERTLARIVVEQGTLTRIKNLNDLTMHILNLPHRTTIGIKNKSHSTVVVRLDCAASENCISHRGTLDFTTEVPPRTTFIALHLLPANVDLPYVPKCEEMLIK